MLKSSQNPKKKSKAQAMVEFALALPVLLLVVYGLLEAGRLLFMYASVVTAARQAARYGSATGDNGSGTNYYNDCAGIQTSARRLEFIQRFTQIRIEYDNPDSSPVWQQGACPITDAGHPVNGDRIKVTVSTIFNPIVPLLVPLRQFTITSTSNRTILVGIPIEVDTPVVGFPPGSGGLISISKVPSSTTYQRVGDIITYTYVIGNPGSDPVYPVGPTTITDDKTTVNCPASVGTTPIAGGTSAPACTSTYVITQADVDAGSVTNTATGRAKTVDGTDLTAVISKTITLVPIPQMTLTKVGIPPETLEVGQLVRYTFTILNDGNVPLTAYAISDSLISNVTCPSTPNPLPASQSVVCTGNYALKNSDLGGNGVVTNTATASAHYGATTVTATDTVTTPIPVLWLKSVTGDPNPATSAGQVLTYTYTYFNRSGKTLGAFSITDSKLGTFTCPGTLNTGTQGTCTHTYTVTQADLEAGLISTTSTVSGTTQSNPIRTWISNAFASTVGVTQLVQMTVTKTANPSAPTAPATALTLGQVITYSYTLTNTGNITLKAPYTVTDDKLGAVTCGTADLTPTGATKSLNCTSLTYTLMQADLDAGSITNHVTASALTKVTGLPTSQATASATVFTYGAPRLSIVKTSSPAFFTAAGQTITYTYTLKNTGNVSLAVNPGYALTDDKLGPVVCGAIGTLPIGGSAICKTIPYPTTAADVTATSITNHVSANAGSTTTPTTPSPSTSLKVSLYVCNTTTLTGSGPIPDGSDVTWTITNNTGFPVHIASAVVSWVGTARINQALLNGVSIWTGSSPSSITLPGAPWTLNNGANPLNLKFSASASTIHIVLSFSESSCNFSLMSSP